MTPIMTDEPTRASRAEAETEVMNGQLSRRPLMATWPLLIPGPLHCRTTVACAVWRATTVNIPVPWQVVMPSVDTASIATLYAPGSRPLTSAVAFCVFVTSIDPVIGFI